MRVLTGEEIAKLAEKGLLFSNGFKKAHCETMFYSLTLGRKIQSVTKNEKSFHEIKDEFIIEAQEVVNVEVLEQFDFNDEQGLPRYGGLIVAKAGLLSVGIFHPSTVVDPGFNRRTYLTLANLRSYPGPALIACHDKIAKIMIFEYSLQEVLPKKWEEPRHYQGIGPNELPTFYDRHAAPWQPAQQTSLEDLKKMINLGIPFDQIAVALIEHDQAMKELKSHASLSETAVKEIKESIKEQQNQLIRADLKFDHVIPRMDQLNNDMNNIKAELQTWRQTHLDHLYFRWNIWISLGMATVGAILGIIGTVLIQLWIK